MVSEANAVVNPRTMVVHPKNTSVADAAMVTSIWLIPHAPLTMSALACVLGLDRGESLLFLGEFRRVWIELPLSSVWNRTRVNQDATDEAIHQQRCVTVEENYLPHASGVFSLVTTSLWEIKL